MSICNRFLIPSRRINTNISADTRNAILVVAILITTATYQATLSPPGGVWQDDSTSPNSFGRPHVAGTAIMTADKLVFFFVSSTVAFGVSIGVIIILLPPNLMFWMPLVSLVCLISSYVISIGAISPSETKCVLILLLTYLVTFLFVLMPVVVYGLMKIVKGLKKFLGRFRAVTLTQSHSRSSIP